MMLFPKPIKFNVFQYHNSLHSPAAIKLSTFWGTNALILTLGILMIKYEQDPDVVRWGLQLFDTYPYPNYGCCGSILQQNTDYFPGHYLEEYNCGTESSNAENHDLSVNCLHEELLRISDAEQSKSFQEGVDHSQTSLYSPNWFTQSPGNYTFGIDSVTNSWQIIWFLKLYHHLAYVLIICWTTCRKWELRRRSNWFGSICFLF